MSTCHLLWAVAAREQCWFRRFLAVFQNKHCYHFFSSQHCKKLITGSPIIANNVYFKTRYWIYNGVGSAQLMVFSSLNDSMILWFYDRKSFIENMSPTLEAKEVWLYLSPSTLRQVRDWELNCLPFKLEVQSNTNSKIPYVWVVTVMKSKCQT